jgi:hypothetical protein
MLRNKSHCDTTHLPINLFTKYPFQIKPKKYLNYEKSFFIKENKENENSYLFPLSLKAKNNRERKDIEII